MSKETKSCENCATWGKSFQCGMLKNGSCDNWQPAKEVEKTCKNCGTNPEKLICDFYSNNECKNRSHWTPFKEQAPTETKDCNRCDNKINDEFCSEGGYRCGKDKKYYKHTDDKKHIANLTKSLEQAREIIKKACHDYSGEYSCEYPDNKPCAKCKIHKWLEENKEMEK